jgi:hypothetical protein
MSAPESETSSPSASGQERTIRPAKKQRNNGGALMWMTHAGSLQLMTRATLSVSSLVHPRREKT